MQLQPRKQKHKSKSKNINNITTSLHCIAQLEGREISGAAQDSASLYCGNLEGNKWLQVTQASARVIDASTGLMVQECFFPGDQVGLFYNVFCCTTVPFCDDFPRALLQAIGLCAANGSQLILVNGCDICYFSLVDGVLVQTGYVAGFLALRRRVGAA